MPVRELTAQDATQTFNADDMDMLTLYLDQHVPLELRENPTDRFELPPEEAPDLVTCAEERARC